MEERRNGVSGKENGTAREEEATESNSNKGSGMVIKGRKVGRNEAKVDALNGLKTETGTWNPRGTDKETELVLIFESVG